MSIWSDQHKLKVDPFFRGKISLHVQGRVENSKKLPKIRTPVLVMIKRSILLWPKNAVKYQLSSQYYPCFRQCRITVWSKVFRYIKSIKYWNILCTGHEQTKPEQLFWTVIKWGIPYAIKIVSFISGQALYDPSGTRTFRRTTAK